MHNDQSLPGASDGVPRCRRYRQMTVAEQGLVLGAGTLLVTIQIHEPTRIWPKKTLIDYDPAGPGQEPVLRWLNDATLNVDLGRVCWVSSRANRVGNIHIIYIYSKADPSP